MSASAVTRTRVVIVDDHPLFRDGLRRLIETASDLEVIGEAGDGDAACTLAHATQPDVVLLDVHMPGGGLPSIAQVRALAPKARILLLTSGIDAGELKVALRDGARGLLLKTAATPLILKAIRAIAAGEYWVGRDFVNELAQSLFDPEAGTGRGTALTSREKQVLTLAAQGFGNREIAARLSISEHTVKHHMTNIFEKTGRTSRVDLAVYAMQNGLVMPGAP